jgi:hypothetical protein
MQTIQPKPVERAFRVRRAVETDGVIKVLAECGNALMECEFLHTEKIPAERLRLLEADPASVAAWEATNGFSLYDKTLRLFLVQLLNKSSV